VDAALDPRSADRKKLPRKDMPAAQGCPWWHWHARRAKIVAENALDHPAELSRRSSDGTRT